MTGFHPLVEWQASQLLLLAMCVADFPVAAVPLWQLKQLPNVSSWSTLLIDDQMTVLWQSSQAFLVAMCCAGLPMARTHVLVAWQPLQVLAVPLNRPRKWQLSQATFWCVPVSGNSVAL